MRHGMTAVLREGGAEIVGSEEEPAALSPAAVRLQPDAVILGREHADSREAGELVHAEAPRTTVVLWARDKDVMEVVEPGARAA